MAERGATDELEHIELEPGPSRPTRSSWPRRRLVALAVVVAMVAGLAGPVRSQSVQASFQRLRSIWLEAKAVTAEHDHLRNELNLRAAPQDDAILRRANAALDAEVARELHRLQRAANGDVRARLDGRVHRLRTMLDTALRGPRLGPTARIDAEVAALARRFHAPPARPGGTGHLTAARDALARFSQYADLPTGVTVLATVGQGLTVIDIDGDTVRTLPLAGTEADNYAYLAGRPAWLYTEGATPMSRAVEPDLRSTVALGPGWGVASIDPDRAWLGTDSTVTEVDRTGRAHSAAIPLPPGMLLSGPATAAGLLLAEIGRPFFTIWDPHSGRTVLRGPGLVIGAAADVVVTVDSPFESAFLQPTALHVIDVRTGRERFGLPPSSWTRQAVFAPDGRTFAVGSVGGITVVDVASGTSEHVESAGSTGPMAWSPSGRWLFYADDRLAAWDTHLRARLVLRVRLPLEQFGSLAVADS